MVNGELMVGDENYGLRDFFFDILDVPLGGMLGMIKNELSHNKNVSKLHQYVGAIRKEFDPTTFLETIYVNKDKIIDLVKNSFITELIEPMVHQIENIRSQVGSKEAMLENVLLLLKKRLVISSQTSGHLKKTSCCFSPKTLTFF